MYVDKLNDIVNLQESSRDVNVELELSNYATRTDFKNATVVDTSAFSKKEDLANLKSDVNKFDTDELKKMYQAI